MNEPGPCASENSSTDYMYLNFGTTTVVVLLRHAIVSTKKAQKLQCRLHVATTAVPTFYDWGGATDTKDAQSTTCCHINIERWERAPLHMVLPPPWLPNESSHVAATGQSVDYAL